MRFGIQPALAGQINDRKKKIANFVLDRLLIAGVNRRLRLSEFLVHFRHHVADRSNRN